MNNNSLIYGLIFGLILAPGFTALELKFFSFLVRIFKINLKLNRPVEVLSLIIIELIAFFSSIKPVLNVHSFYSVVIFLLLLTIIYGLWKLKKWTLYVYLISAVLAQFNFITLGFDLRLSLVSFLSQVLILLVYYIYVYTPNKKEFK
jgi:hypothetical protein